MLKVIYKCCSILGLPLLFSVYCTCYFEVEEKLHVEILLYKCHIIQPFARCPEMREKLRYPKYIYTLHFIHPNYKLSIK